MNVQVMAALKEKRRTLSGEIEVTQHALRELVHQLDAIDAALRVFDPTLDLVPPRDRPVPIQSASFRGETTRLILTTLRENGKPMQVAAITERVMIGRGLSPTDLVFVRTMRKRIFATLRHLRKRKVVVSIPSLNLKNVFWTIAPNSPEAINENAPSAPL